MRDVTQSLMRSRAPGIGQDRNWVTHVRSFNSSSNGATGKLTALLFSGISLDSFEHEHDDEHEDEPLVAAAPRFCISVVNNHEPIGS